MSRWIEFEGYKDKGTILKGWLIDKGKWIVVGEALLHLKPTGLINQRQSTTLTNKC